MRLLRKLRDRVGRWGLEIRTVRGRSNWRAGVEVLWHPFDEQTERVRISKVAYAGRTARFLVRNANDHIQSFHAAGRYFGEEELAALSRFYRGGLFVDVGANVGNHAIFAARIMNAPYVLAFEPNSVANTILRCNVALNELQERILVHDCALGARDGRGRMAEPRFAANLGATPIAEDGDDFHIAKGDEIIGNRIVGFIKIDVEGFELEVLKGLSSTIARDRPSMMVEVDQHNREAFDRLIDELGYRLVEELPESECNANCFVVPRDAKLRGIGTGGNLNTGT